MSAKCSYLQYDTVFFALPVGLEIDDKSIPKRLKDKIVFQEAKDTKQIANIGLS